MREAAVALLALALAGCPAPTIRPGSQGLPGLDGYGAAEFTSAEAEVRSAYGAALSSDFLPEEPQGCYYLWPPEDAPLDGVAFMFEGGKFVRYDAYGTRLVGPGGLRVGMSAAAVEAAFPGQLSRRAAVHDPDGVELVLDPGNGHASRVVFELDASGTIVQWRVGLEPQVHYVEGCL